jgi:hypothetical protein
MCSQMKPSVRWRSSFSGDFRDTSYSVFGVDFRVKWDCVHWRIQKWFGDAVSLIISKSAATQFSLQISESTWTLCADESTRQPWKHCLWWFLSRQLHSFRWWFSSQQGLCARTNPSLSWRCSLVHAFWVGSDSVFACDFRVNRDFVRWQIHATTVEAMSLVVFESATTQHSVTTSESTGTVCADESRLQLWRQSRSCFLSPQRLSFHFQFRSQHGLCALMNPRVIFGSIVIDGFWFGSYTTFDDDFRVNRTVCADEYRLQLEAIALMVS